MRCFLVKLSFTPLIIVSLIFQMLGSASVVSAASATPDSAIPLTYFGMHFHRLDAGTPWPSIPIGTWRLWDSFAAWPNLEPERGKWDFKRLDRYVAMAKLSWHYDTATARLESSLGICQAKRGIQLPAGQRGRAERYRGLETLRAHRSGALQRENS